MLEDCLFASRPSTRTRKPGTLALSVVIHGALGFALILIPLFQNQVLPQIALFEPLQPPVVPKSIRIVDAPVRAGGGAAKVPGPVALIAPEVIPKTIAIISDEPPSTIRGAIPGDRGTGLQGNPLGAEFGIPGTQAAPPLPPPPPPPAPPSPPPAPEVAPTAPVPRGGLVMQSNLIHTVKPTYPRLAVVTRTQGAVILEAIITREGTIDPARLRVLQGSPLLVPAAVEAVQQWRYRPTLLNGQPVEVLTTITVNFTLN